MRTAAYDRILNGIGAGWPIEQALAALGAHIAVLSGGGCAFVIADPGAACWRCVGEADIPADKRHPLLRLLDEGVLPDIDGEPGDSDAADIAVATGATAVLPLEMHGLLGFLVCFTADPAKTAGLGTELHLAEVILRAYRAAAGEAQPDSRTDLLLAVEGAGTGVWEHNLLTGRIQYSPAWKALLGYAEHELSNSIEEARERIHPDDIDSVQTTLQAHVEGETDRYVAEYRLRCKDGRYKWVVTRGKVLERDTRGRALRMGGTTVDISSAKEEVQALRETVDLVTDLTDEIPGMVFEYRRRPDGTARFTYASAGIGRIFGLSAKQVLHDDAALDEVILADDLPHFRTLLADSAARLAPWQMQFRVRLAGGIGWRQLSARPRRLADGATQWHGYVSDITEYKRMERQMHDSGANAGVASLAGRDTLLASIDAETARMAATGVGSAALLLVRGSAEICVRDDAEEAWLRAVAQPLWSVLRQFDSVARVRRAEVAALLPMLDRQQAQSLADQLLHCLPASMSGTTSVHVAVLEPGTDAKAMLHRLGSGEPGTRCLTCVQAPTCGRV
jgi:PAS domain S-box-containing protein